MSAPHLELEDGFVPRGIRVDGPAELEALLSQWFTASDRHSVGDAQAFGGSPVITVRMGADEFVLNADTKRSAVEEFLRTARQADGADRLRWHVTKNRRGKLNRVSYRPDNSPTPGWYAYLRKPASERRELEVPRRTRGLVESLGQPSQTRTATPDDSKDRVLGATETAYIVQFPHPGAEHRPPGPIELHLPHQSDGLYRIGTHVGCDLDRLTQHTRAADQADAADEAEHLQAALELVEGAPFSSTKDGYGWAHTEGLITHAIVTVDNTAHRLAELALQGDDPEQATWAARKGLTASWACEACYRNLMRAAVAQDDQTALDAIYNELIAIVDDEQGADTTSWLDPETIELYERHRRRRRNAG